jgi:hypothetical protein
MLLSYTCTKVSRTSKFQKRELELLEHLQSQGYRLQCYGSGSGVGSGSGRIRSRIRIRSDPKLFAGSGVGSGINHFGYGSVSPNFPLACVCERFIIYFHDRSTCFPAAEYADQGVKKKCRLSWLTNSALVYEPECGREEELLGLSQ